MAHDGGGGQGGGWCGHGNSGGYACRSNGDERVKERRHVYVEERWRGLGRSGNDTWRTAAMCGGAGERLVGRRRREGTRDEGKWIGLGLFFFMCSEPVEGL